MANLEELFDTPRYLDMIEDVKRRFPHLHTDDDYANHISYYSEINVYDGPIVEFKSKFLGKDEKGKTLYEFNEEVERIDKTARDLIINPTINCGNPVVEHALSLRALYIKTDPRATKFPELNGFADEKLYNVKLDDLLDYNLGKSFDEISMNCMRLSISKVFDIDYNKIAREMLPYNKTLTESKPSDILQAYDLKLKLAVEYIKENTLHGIKLMSRSAVDPTPRLKKFMDKRKLKEVYGIVNVFKARPAVGGHSMTIRATKNSRGEIIHMIIDHQVNVGFKPPIEELNRNSDVVRFNPYLDVVKSGTRFTEMSYWLEKNFEVGFILKDVKK